MISARIARTACVFAFAISVAHAAAHLPAVCSAAGSLGTPDCPTASYAFNYATDQTLVKSSNVWQKLVTVPPSGAIVDCPGDVTPGAAVCPVARGTSTKAELATPPVYGVRVTWTTPPTNTDGTTLTNLSGYRVEYGNTDFVKQMTVGPINTTSLVEGLAPGPMKVRVFTLAGANESLPLEAAGVAEPVIVVPTPVDCAVSAWSAWTVGALTPATCPASGQQTHADTRTRTIVTPPANGGAVCPVLTDSQTVPVACTPPVEAPLTPTGSLAYELQGTKMVPVGVLTGFSNACGALATIAGVKYCKLSRLQVDYVNWPTDLTLASVYAKAK